MPTWSTLKHFDLILALAVGLLLLIGLILMYGASLANEDGTIFWRQLVYVVLGLVLATFLAFYNYHTLARQNRFIYVVLALLLLGLLIFGDPIRGSARWIDFGLFQLQPSELMKLSVLIAMSRWLYLKRGEINTWKNILTTLILAVIPAGLVLWQPDLGSSFVIGALWAGLLAVSWVKKKYLIYVALALVVASGLSWEFVLQDFQRERVEVFLNPNLDPRGRGYNVRQAKIAVGSGQWFGQGVGKGLQSQLKFLPERHTDFIFATAAEEVGFLGATVILGLFMLILFRIWIICRRARDELGMYMAVGVFLFFFIQIFVNVGMNLGLLPVTGIPLPLLSYGGSSMLATLMAVGIAQNIARQSRALRF